MRIYKKSALKRIVHEEQSQREIQLEECIFRHWCEDFVRESWNRPRSSVQLKYSVDPALKDIERVIVILIAN